MYPQWRLFLFVGSFLCGFSAFAFMFLPESPKFLLAIGEQEKCYRILRSIYDTNKSEVSENYPVKSIASLKLMGTSITNVQNTKEALRLVWSQTKELIHRPHLCILSLLCSAMFLLYFVCVGALVWLVILE